MDGEYLKYKNKYLKYKNKYLKLKLVGGFSVSINVNDILYQSIPITRSTFNDKYPMFFTPRQKGALIYVNLNPENNILKMYRNKEQRRLIWLNNKYKDTDITNLPILLGNQDNIIIVMSILNIFFGMANNIEEVLENIETLIRIEEVMIGYCRFFNHQNIRENIYAGFNQTENFTIMLNEIKEKIITYRCDNPNIKILPSRTTVRVFDILLTNMLKLKINHIYHGFYYEEINLHQIKTQEQNVITLNEVLTNENKIVPTEICLFNGYNNLEPVLSEEIIHKDSGSILRKKHNSVLDANT
jgi:hypothetical protein